MLAADIKESVETNSEAKLPLAYVVPGEMSSPNYDASDLKLSTSAPTSSDDKAKLSSVNADNDQLSLTSAQSDPHSDANQRPPPAYSSPEVSLLPRNFETMRPMSLQSHYGHHRPVPGYENRPQPEDYGTQRSTSSHSEYDDRPLSAYSVYEQRRLPSDTDSDQEIQSAYSKSEDKPVPTHRASDLKPLAAHSGKQRPLAEGANSGEQKSAPAHPDTEYRPLPPHSVTNKPTDTDRFINWEDKQLAAYSESKERLLPAYSVSEKVLSPSILGKHRELPASIGSEDRPAYSGSPQKPFSTYLESEMRQEATYLENHRQLFEHSNSNSVQRPAYSGPKNNSSEVGTLLANSRPERRPVAVYSENEESAYSETEEQRPLPAYSDKQRPANTGSENNQLLPSNGSEARPLPDYPRSKVGQLSTYSASKEGPISAYSVNHRPLPVNANPVERPLSVSEERLLPAYTGTQQKPLLTYSRAEERPIPAFSDTRPLPAYTGTGSEQRPLPAYYSRPEQRPLLKHFGTEGTELPASFGKQRPLRTQTVSQGEQSLEFNNSEARPLPDVPMSGQRPLHIPAYSETLEPSLPVQERPLPGIPLSGQRPLHIPAYPGTPEPVQERPLPMYPVSNERPSYATSGSQEKASLASSIDDGRSFLAYGNSEDKSAHPFSSSYDRTQPSIPVSEANKTVHRQLYQETVYGFPYRSREIFIEPNDINAKGKTANYAK